MTKATEAKWVQRVREWRAEGCDGQGVSGVNAPVGSIAAAGTVQKTLVLVSVNGAELTYYGREELNPQRKHARRGGSRPCNFVLLPLGTFRRGGDRGAGRC